jgi:TetR/AcrR family transcriptional repressor of nem operon
MMKTSIGARRGPKPKPDTRANLVRVGLEMMYSDGYAATGIQGITDRAGVPKASFYNHFSSKEEFGAEIVDAYYGRNEGRLRDVFGNPDKKPLERLEGFFEDRIAAFQRADFKSGCLLGNLSAEVADHSTLIRQSIAERLDGWSSFFEECLSEAQARGDIDDQLSPALLARFILNSWEGALLRMRAENSDAALIEFRQIVFGKLLT